MSEQLNYSPIGQPGPDDLRRAACIWSFAARNDVDALTETIASIPDLAAARRALIASVMVAGHMSPVLQTSEAARFASELAVGFAADSESADGAA